jgi:hypothetical protein
MPRYHYPRQKFPMRIAEEAGRAWGRSGLVQKISSATGLEPRTVKLVDHYTNYAMPGAI